MKKIFTLFAFALLASLQTVMAQSLYVLGIDNVWNPSQPSLTLEPSADGTYKFDYTTSGITWFAFGTVLGVDENDWAPFNASRLAPESPDLLLVDGDVANLVVGMDRSFQIDEGEWSFTVDLQAMTLSVAGKGVGPVDDIPEHIYVLGIDGTWNPAEPSLTLDAYEEGMFKFDFDLEEEEWFALGTKLGADSDDWLTFNKYRLGAPQADFTLEHGWNVYFVKGADTSFHLNPGQGTIIVDYKQGTVTCPLLSSGIHSAATSAAPAAIYDMVGRREAQPQHGIYVQDGRKIVK